MASHVLLTQGPGWPGGCRAAGWLSTCDSASRSEVAPGDTGAWGRVGWGGGPGYSAGPQETRAYGRGSVTFSSAGHPTRGRSADAGRC